MRLAFVSTMGGSPWGGSEALWSAAAMAALEQGHQVLVSVYDWGALHPKIKELQAAGAEIHLRPRYDANQNFARKVSDYTNRKLRGELQAYRRIIDFSPDHVVVSQGDSFDLLVHHYPLAAAMISQGILFSLICHGHAQYGLIPNSEIYPRGKAIYERAANIFVVSKRMAALLQRRLCTRLNNIHFTWNPLNLERLVCLPWPDEAATSFAIVGSLGDEKGIDTAFECFAGDKWQQRQWQLNLYGAGYGRSYLEDLARYFGLESRVSFHGYVNDISAVWRHNQMLLIPSAGEGLPISLIEAFMCGRPTVATDVGGIAEVVEEGETGYMAEAPTVTSFAHAMERAWAHHDQWQAAGKLAHTRIRSHCKGDPVDNLLHKVTATHE